jgi:hypothetical protein
MRLKLSSKGCREIEGATGEAERLVQVEDLRLAYPEGPT